MSATRRESELLFTSVETAPQEPAGTVGDGLRLRELLGSKTRAIGGGVLAEARLHFRRMGSAIYEAHLALKRAHDALPEGDAKTQVAGALRRCEPYIDA